EAAAGAAAPAPPALAPASKDELAKPDYIPGYRPDPAIGMSPYVPRVGGLPGGVTPSYGAAIPSNEWTFRWTGFLTASLQASANNRVNATTQQSTTVFHVPPSTVDEYGSFEGTSTMPGQWAQLNFAYGNRYVTANVSLTTWNPTDPTTFYQIGSQQFINNIFLSYNPTPIFGFRVHAMAGYFYNAYGAMGQYGLGLYTNAMIGSVRGVGEDVSVEYDVTDRLTLRLEDGIMGDRNGMGQVSITPLPQNGAGQPVIWPSAWVHHVHAGIEKRGDLTLRLGLHYLTNWSQDDRLQTMADNIQTRPINESYVPDARIVTYGADAAIVSPILGYLGLAVSYTRGTNAYPLKGLQTFGGEGDSLTNRWWGQITGGGVNVPVTGGGTGTLIAAGLNYAASIGRIISYPVPFNGDGPDLSLQLGWIVAESSTDFQAYNGRLRQKFGADLIYTFLPNVAVALRGDAVFPNSRDSGENFYVLSPRLIFKSDWNSRDTLSLIYGKWFYGPRTHPEASTITPGDRLDDQLFAVNVQMWW
ncbi:MAG: hypothetical protein JOZ69_09270, partial [Myxococcales bacterium]|nr:hypothetical protein [Myxococcales bacterium]